MSEERPKIFLFSEILALPCLTIFTVSYTRKLIGSNNTKPKNAFTR